jgi:hypothetical protein
MTTLIRITVLALTMATPALAQEPAKKRPAPAPAAAPKPAAPAAKPAAEREPIKSAVTLGLRAGYNLPGSELSPGFVPDVDVGYRIALGQVALEPAFGFERFGGDREVTVTSAQLAESSKVKQTVSATVWEGRARLWYDLKDAGYPILGFGVGGVAAEAEQTSFGEKRSESKGALTWAVQLGYAYPIDAAYGNAELLVGYRGATVDMVETGAANLSGVQILLGWHAAF